jgi:hypothetical protein
MKIQAQMYSSLIFGGILLRRRKLGRSSTRPSLRTYALEIDGRPTLAFEATSISEAQAICSDLDFRLDLATLTSGGIPILSLTAKLAPRPATEQEATAFKRAVDLAPPSDEPTIAFLIEVDGVRVIAIDPSP